MIGWKERYFKISEGILSYYVEKSQQNEVCKGSYNLSQCRIDFKTSKIIDQEQN